MSYAKGMFGLVALGVCLFSIPSAADGPRPTKDLLAQANVTPSRVEWLPLTDSKRLVLTVAGQGVYLQREFSAADTPSFSSLDFKDGVLPDGVYAYELRGDEGQVQSGHLWVQGGSFVVDKPPIRPAPTRQSSAESKQPLRNVTAPETVLPDDLVVQGKACIGDDCMAGDANGPPLKIKQTANYQILFSTLNCCFPSEHDWTLQAGGHDGFSDGDFVIHDSIRTPFRIGAVAPDNALTLASAVGINPFSNVGMGTSTPAERLHVFSSEDANTIILSENSSTGVSAAGVLRAKSNTATVNFQAHGGGRTLSRFGQTLGSWAEFLQVTGNGLIVGTLADKPLILGTNSTNRVHIAADGKVGVGTSAPGSKLDIVANIASSEAARVTNQSASGYAGFSYFDESSALGLFFGLDNANNTTRLNSVNNNPIVMLTNSAEHVRVDSDGDVGINCNNPTSDLVIASGSGCSTPSSSINAGSSQFTVSSSRTLKENLATVRVPALLDRIASVNVFTYDFIGGPKSRLGLMAEDFHEVFERGSDKVIDGQEVEMALWLAVQELTAQNKQLKAHDEELSRRLADLEARFPAAVSKP